MVLLNYYVSIEGAYRMSSHKDQEILDMLLQHIAYERVQDKQLLTSAAIAAASTNSSTHTDLTLMDTNLTSTLVSSSSLASSSYIPQSSLDITQLYARGLTVFDKQVHMVRNSNNYRYFIVFSLRVNFMWAYIFLVSHQVTIFIC